MKVSIVVECSSCAGSGLYQGIAESDGFAVICHRCGGSGAEVLAGNQFKGRRVRSDIIRVGVENQFKQNSVVNTGSISYQQFTEGQFPHEISPEKCLIGDANHV